MTPPSLTRRRPPATARLRALLLVAAAVTVLATAPRAHAQPAVQRFIQIQVSQSELDLGSLSPGMPAISNTVLTVQVGANFSHAGVFAQVSPLHHESLPAVIDAERVSVRSPHTSGFVSLSTPVNLTGSMPPGLFSTTLEFRVDTQWSDPPGTYSGTLTLTYGLEP